MQTQKKRLTLDLDPPVQRRLKAVAALKGISMRRYCLTAIDRELARDEANGTLTGSFNIEETRSSPGGGVRRQGPTGGRC